MLILKAAALWMLVLGAGGIPGAIETGTSPVRAAAVFLAGCLLMAVYLTLEKEWWKEG